MINFVRIDACWVPRREVPVYKVTAVRFSGGTKEVQSCQIPFALRTNVQNIHSHRRDTDVPHRRVTRWKNCGSPALSKFKKICFSSYRTTDSWILCCCLAFNTLWFYFSIALELLYIIVLVSIFP